MNAVAETSLPASCCPAPDGEAPPRFTLDGDDALERHLELTCARVLSGLRGSIPASRLEAVLLGGGYGRGEGGVWRDAAGDRPYNDLEFYVAIEGNRHLSEFLFQTRLHVLAEILTKLAGVEVEFKITSLAELTRRPISMFSYDLVVGHRLLWGARNPGLCGCEHHRVAAKIPIAEATRLLMNRCSGLLLAGQRLHRGNLAPVDAEFVRRNIAKTQLAVGDAALAARGLYHWSCRERQRRLEQLAHTEPSAWHRELLRHHAAGLAFKLHPADAPVAPDVLAERYDAVKAFAGRGWRWVEARRLGRTVPSMRAYALGGKNLYPDTNHIKNLVLNFRADRGRLRWGARPWRHPRERVCRSLALLLWEPLALGDWRLRRRLEADLGRSVPTFDGAVEAYERLWARVR